MHFQNFSIVIGTRACNAECPFCISRQTGLFGTPKDINFRNFHIACELAKKANTTTVLLTGKGEPTLYPKNITAILCELKRYNFPLVEIQTNGINLANETIEDDVLKKWYELGLTTIALSVVHYQSADNNQIYRPTDSTYFDLSDLIKKLHKIGFSVRLCVMLLKGYIDSPKKVQEMIYFAESTKTEQLTFRNITSSETTEDDAVTKWTKENALSNEQLTEIVEYIKNKGVLLYHLMHGMDVYDINGQNVCLGNCLTMDPTQNDFRQLIFFPDGSLYWDWQYKGARIL